MRNQTDKEKTAVKAVFLLGDVIDGINQAAAEDFGIEENFHSADGLARNATKLADSIVNINRKGNKKILAKITPGLIWEGWTCEGEELLDPAGNKYGLHEIRAIFYTRQQIQTLRNVIAHLQPLRLRREPQQLTLDFMHKLPYVVPTNRRNRSVAPQHSITARVSANRDKKIAAAVDKPVKVNEKTCV